MISDRIPEMQKICLNLKEQCFNSLTALNADWIVVVKKKGPKSECNYSLENIPRSSGMLIPDSVSSASQILEMEIFRNLFLIEEFNKLNDAIQYYGSVIKVIEEDYMNESGGRMHPFI
jgi:hypothetical protein